MLQTGRLRTTWFYSWGQLLGQIHGGSGSWTTSKTYLTSSSLEYQRTMVKWIYHFPRYEGSGPKQMGMLIEGISIHDRSGLSWLLFKSWFSLSHMFFLSGEWALQVRDATATKWATTFFEVICVFRNKKRNIDQFLRGIDWVTTGLQRFAFFLDNCRGGAATEHRHRNASQGWGKRKSLPKLQFVILL